MGTFLRRRADLFAWTAAALAAFPSAHADDPAPPAGDRDRQAVFSAAKAYQEALAQGDIAALERLWAPGGDIVDGSGTTISARDALASEAASAKAGRKPPVVSLSETSLRFLSPDVALEDGTAEVPVAGTSRKFRGHFTAGWVRTKEGWKIAFLRESRIDEPSAKASLLELEPFVGEWRPAAGDESIRLSVRWNKDKTFLLRDMTITTDDKREIEISQRIGVDPVSGQIHSWSFSSDGGHGEGIWARDGTAWVAQTSAVSPDGGRSTSLNVYSLEDGNRLRWRSFRTSVADSHMPPVDVVLVKVPAKDPAKDQGKDRGPPR